MTVELIYEIVDGELNDLLLNTVYGCLYLKRYIDWKKKIIPTQLETTGLKMHVRKQTGESSVTINRTVNTCLKISPVLSLENLL